MNDKIINQAINEINLKKQQALETYNNHIEEIEKKIPEITILHNKLNSVGREIIAVSMGNHMDLKSKIDEIRNTNQQIQSRIEQLLTINGYDKDYLKIKYSCPLCKDTGFKKDAQGLELNEYCDCLLSMVKNLTAKQINQNLDINRFTFENFDLNKSTRINTSQSQYNDTSVNLYEHMRKNIDFLKNYCNTFQSNSPSILIYGKTGLGKTHISMAIANELIKKGFSVIYKSAGDLFSQIADENFNYNYGKSSNKETLDAILSVDLLIIDDLGTEMENNRLYKSILYSILNTRYLKMLPILINTNCNLIDLNQRYDERILSRILSYKNIEFLGRDYREVQGLQTNSLQQKFVNLKEENKIDGYC